MINLSGKRVSPSGFNEFDEMMERDEEEDARTKRLRQESALSIISEAAEFDFERAAFV